jgi:hypothetical protein
MQKKEQGNLEARIRNVRFIAELTKFSIVPHRVALDYFQVCSCAFFSFAKPLLPVYFPAGAAQ